MKSLTGMAILVALVLQGFNSLTNAGSAHTIPATDWQNLLADKRERLARFAPGDPRRSGVFLEFVTPAVRANRATDLAEIWAERLAKDPEPGLARALARLAPFTSKSGELLEKLREVSSQFPDDIPLLEQVALLEFFFGTPQESLKSWGRLREHLSGELSPVFGEALTLIKMGDTEAATELVLSWEPGPGTSSGDLAHFEQRKFRFFETHSLHQARHRLLANRLQRDPGDQEAAFLLVEDFLAAGKPDRANELLRKSLAHAGTSDSENALARQAVEAFSSSGEFELAAEWTGILLQNHPRDVETISQRIDLLRMAGQSATAATELSEILQQHWLDQGELPPERLDRKFFEVLSLPDPPATPERSLDLADSIPRGSGGSLALDALLTELEKEARLDRNEISSLRLARFSQWSGKPRAARDTLREALLLHPDSLPLRELAIQFARERGDFESAIEFSETLIELDPARARDRKRELAELLALADRAADAAEILGELVHEHPDDSDARALFAEALQNDGQWFAAASQWEVAARLEQDSDKLQRVLSQGIAAARRVGRSQTALRLMMQRSRLLEEEGTEDTAFLEVQNFAIQTGLEDVLEEILQDPAISPPAASPPTPKPIADIPKGDLSSAERHSPAIRQPPAITTVHLENPALLLEEGSAFSASASPEKILLLLQQCFPRNRPILEAAAEVYTNRGERIEAAQTWSRLAEVAPDDPWILLEAARANLAVGERVRAVEFLEDLLALPTQKTASGQFPVFLDLPLETRSRILRKIFSLRGTSGAWSPARSSALSTLAQSSGSSTPNARTEAIQLLSHLLRNAPDADTWMEAWKQLPSTEEAVHGLLSIGAVDEAIDLLQATASEQPLDPLSVHAFFQTCIEWNQMRTALDFLEEKELKNDLFADLFLFALLERLHATEDAWIDELLLLAGETPELSGPFLHTLATLFVGESLPSEAAAMGVLAIPRMPEDQRPSVQRDVVAWFLEDRDFEAAKETADAAPTTFLSFASPAAELLRFRWVLSNASEKESLLEKVRAAAMLETPGSAAPALLLESLSHRLYDETAGELARLLSDESQTAAGARYFAAEIRDAVGRLRRWNLPEAASLVAQAALEPDQALLRLRKQIDTMDTTRLQIEWVVSVLSSIPPSERAAFLSEWTQISDPPDFLFRLAEHCIEAEDPLSAAIAYQFAVERDPESTYAMNGLWKAAQLLQDHATLASLCQLSASGNGPDIPVEEAVASGFAWNLSLLQKENAARLLSKALDQEPDNPAYLQRLAAFQYLSGDLLAAIKSFSTLWQQEPRDGFAIPLLRISAQLENQTTAIEVLENLPPDRIETVLQTLWNPDFPKNEQQILATWILSEFPELPQSLGNEARIRLLASARATTELLEVLGEVPDTLRQLELLTAALEEFPDSAELQQRYGVAALELLQAPKPLPHATAQSIAAWITTTAPETTQDAVAALQSRWQKGELSAGYALLLSGSARDSRLAPPPDSLLREFLAHPDLDPAITAELFDLFTQQENFSAASLAWEALPREQQDDFQKVLLLRANGEYQDAERLLGQLKLRTVLDPDLLPRLGNLLIAIGRHRSAIPIFLDGTFLPSPSTAKTSWLGLAECELLSGNPEGAAAALQEALVYPGPPSAARHLLGLAILSGSEIQPGLLREFPTLQPRDRADFLGLAAAWLTANHKHPAARSWLSAFPELLLRPEFRELQSALTTDETPKPSAQSPASFQTESDFR